jgi:hypothetical protein
MMLRRTIVGLALLLAAAAAFGAGIAVTQDQAVAGCSRNC